MEIFSVNDEKFRKYGKVWNNIECTKLIKGMEHTPLPEDVIYVPSVEELEAVPEAKTFSERVFWRTSNPDWLLQRKQSQVKRGRIS